MDRYKNIDRNKNIIFKILENEKKQIYSEAILTIKDKKILIEDIDKMSPKDKNNLMNELIDKGVNNLSEYDKKILKKLSI